MPLEFTIRPYEEADHAAVARLWNEVLPGTAAHHDPATSISKKLAVGGDLFYVAVVGGTAVGTVMGGYDGHRGWIYSVAVNPQYRRQRIATALIRHLERALAERGCLKVNLQVLSSNRDVVAFYEQLGFAVEERISMGKRLYE